MHVVVFGQASILHAFLFGVFFCCIFIDRKGPFLQKDEISSWLLCKSDGSPLCPPSVQHFFIRARAQHVYEEAMRVNRFSDLCAEYVMDDLGT